MKHVLISVALVFLLTPVSSFSQNIIADYSVLFATNYLGQSSGLAKRIYAPISIIYNRNYCSFYVKGKGTVFFKIRDFTSTTVGKYIHTSFVSEETDVTPDGYYGIMIDQGGGETIFQVSLPSDFTFIVDKAKQIDEGGNVPNMYIIDKKDIVQQNIDFDTKKKYSDSINAYWDTVTNINFNSNPKLKQDHLLFYTDINCYINSQLNFHTKRRSVDSFFVEQIHFNIDTFGNKVIRPFETTFSSTNNAASRSPDVIEIQNMNGAEDNEINDKIIKLFLSLPIAIERDIYGKIKPINNCTVNITLVARPLK